MNGNAIQFLGELISFLISFLTANFVFGMSILQIWFVPVLIGLVVSTILGRAKVYRNSSSSKDSEHKGE